MGYISLDQARQNAGLGSSQPKATSSGGYVPLDQARTQIFDANKSKPKVTVSQAKQPQKAQVKSIQAPAGGFKIGDVIGKVKQATASAVTKLSSGLNLSLTKPTKTTKPNNGSDVMKQNFMKPLTNFTPGQKTLTPQQLKQVKPDLGTNEQTSAKMTVTNKSLTQQKQQQKQITSVLDTIKKALPETSKALDEFTKDPLSLKSDIKKVPEAVWNSIKDPVIEYLKTKETNLTTRPKSLSEDIGRSLHEVSSAANVVFAPLTALFEGANQVPVLGGLSKAITLPFLTAGEGAVKTSDKIIDSLPLSKDTKKNLKPAVGEIFALASQLALGKAVEIGTKRAGLTDKYGPEEAQTIIREAHKLANQKTGNKDITEILKEGEHTPDEVINAVLQNKLEKTPDGMTLIKHVVEAKAKQMNIQIGEKTIGELQREHQSPDLTKYEDAFNKSDTKTLDSLAAKYPGDSRFNIHKTPGAKATDEQLINTYRSQFKDELLLNTDNVREVYKPEGYNRINSAEFHDRANKLSNEIFQQDIKTLDKGDKYLFTAGSSGAGKTMSIHANKDILNDVKAGLDGNFSSNTALEKLDKVIKTGAEPRIAFFYREPLDAWINGVIKRAANPENGRVVPLEIFLHNLEQSPKMVLEAHKKYGDKVDIQVIDNSLGKGNAKVVDKPVEFLEKINYNIDDVKQKAIQAIEENVKAGTISEETGKALMGTQISEKPKPQRQEQSKPSVKPQPNAELNKEAQTPVGQGKITESKAYSRVIDRLSEESQLDVNYNKLNLKEDAEKALNLVTEDPNQATRIALGLEKPPAGQTETAISIALADKAFRDGNMELASQLEASRSLRQTRRGQEIVSERGRFSDNSPYFYMRELMDRRLKTLGTSVKSAIKEAAGKANSAKQAAMEKIDEKTAQLKARLKKDQKKIKAAQDIIDALRC